MFINKIKTKAYSGFSFKNKGIGGKKLGFYKNFRKEENLNIIF